MNLLESKDFISTTKHSISLCVYADFLSDSLFPQLENSFIVNRQQSLDSLQQYIANQSLFNLPDVILIEVDDQKKCIDFVRKLKENTLLKGLVIVFLSKTYDADLRKEAMGCKVNDLYIAPIPTSDLIERIVFLVKFKLIKPQLSDLAKIDLSYETPILKRLFDIAASGTILVLISPLLLAVAAVLAFESKGPIIFKSKRVGTGYKVFDFYKFRSMRQGASEELKNFSALNQYDKSTGGATTFVKLKNDPRITRFGGFIRKYSIDELPQLINVLKGDMSLVGNRPLPLYEAEMLTSNEWTMRFLGPAGLTGLWQVSRRGKADMSEQERKELDNFYAQNYSFWLDIKILFSTFSAIVQSEKV
jgi:lipopolysaccharide/colanic/teichoic acid biosynthesis glycosyltransferase